MNRISSSFGEYSILPASWRTRPSPGYVPLNRNPTREWLNSSVPSMRVKTCWNTPLLTTALPVPELVKMSSARVRTMTLVTSPSWLKKTVPSLVSLVSRSMAKPSHWMKPGSEPEPESWNLSGDVALAGAANPSMVQPRITAAAAVPNRRTLDIAIPPIGLGIPRAASSNQQATGAAPRMICEEHTARCRLVSGKVWTSPSFVPHPHVTTTARGDVDARRWVAGLREPSHAWQVFRRLGRPTTPQA